MHTALAEEGLFRRELILELARDSNIVPTDFKTVHQDLSYLTGIIETERISLSVRSYEVIKAGGHRQYLGKYEESDEDVQFALEEFLSQNVDAWENRLIAEQKYVVMLLAAKPIRVCMNDYDQVLFYSQQMEYSGLEDALQDQRGV